MEAQEYQERIQVLSSLLAHRGAAPTRNGDQYSESQQYGWCRRLDDDRDFDFRSTNRLLHSVSHMDIYERCRKWNYTGQIVGLLSVCPSYRVLFGSESAFDVPPIFRSVHTDVISDSQHNCSVCVSFPGICNTICLRNMDHVWGSCRLVVVNLILTISFYWTPSPHLDPF